MDDNFQEKTLGGASAGSPGFSSEIFLDAICVAIFSKSIFHKDYAKLMKM